MTEPAPAEDETKRRRRQQTASRRPLSQAPSRELGRLKNVGTLAIYTAGSTHRPIPPELGEFLVLQQAAAALQDDLTVARSPTRALPATTRMNKVVMP